jgi:hypothetical protein
MPSSAPLDGVGVIPREVEAQAVQLQIERAFHP